MRLPHASHAFVLCAALCSPAAARDPHPSAPRRIVSTFLCTDEYLFRLVSPSRIAALSYLAAATDPVVSTIAGQVHGIPSVRASAEQVLTLHPDLVITYENTNVRTTQLLRAAGVNVLELPWAQSLADIRRITRMLGDRLGERRRAEALIAQMDADLRSARAQAPRPPVRTLLYEPNGYATGGGVTDEILSAAGLVNIAHDAHATRAGTVPMEAVLVAAPQLLILNGEREVAPARADLALQHPALESAAAHAFVVRKSLTPLLCPGPWSARLAGALAEWGRKAQVLAANGKRS